LLFDFSGILLILLLLSVQEWQLEVLIDWELFLERLVVTEDLTSCLYISAWDFSVVFAEISL
jgi:hypothetical protein